MTRHSFPLGRRLDPSGRGVGRTDAGRSAGNGERPDRRRRTCRSRSGCRPRSRDHGPSRIRPWFLHRRRRGIAIAGVCGPTRTPPRWRYSRGGGRHFHPAPDLSGLSRSGVLSGGTVHTVPDSSSRSFASRLSNASLVPSRALTRYRSIGGAEPGGRLTDPAAPVQPLGPLLAGGGRVTTEFRPGNRHVSILRGETDAADDGSGVNHVIRKARTAKELTCHRVEVMPGRGPAEDEPLILDHRIRPPSCLQLITGRPACQSFTGADVGTRLSAIGETSDDGTGWPG